MFFNYFLMIFDTENEIKLNFGCHYSFWSIHFEKKNEKNAFVDDGLCFYSVNSFTPIEVVLYDAIELAVCFSNSIGNF